VGRFQLVEVEVSQDDTEQSEAGMWEKSGIFRGKCYKRCHIQEGKYFRRLIITVLKFSTNIEKQIFSNQTIRNLKTSVVLRHF